MRRLKLFVWTIRRNQIKQSPLLGKMKIRYLIIYNDVENALPEKARNLARQYGTELKPWSQKQLLALV